MPIGLKVKAVARRRKNCHTVDYGTGRYDITAFCIVLSINSALFFQIHVSGNWKQDEPRGCATKCGVKAGASGTSGAVTCRTSSCDPNTKPDPKECPKTEDCTL